MAGIEVGSVSVGVVPSAEGFSEKLRAQILPQADSIGKTVGDAIGRPIADKISKAITEGITGPSLKTAGAKAGEDFGGEFARTVRTRIDAALKAIPNVNINADTSEADLRIAGIRTQLEALRSLRIGVDIDEGEALGKIAALSAELKQLGSESSSIRVKADTATATLELDKILAKADEVGRERPEIKVDADTATAEAKLAAIGNSAGNSSGGVRLLIAAGIALAPALVPAAAAAAGALAGIAAAAIAAAAAVGTIGLAFSGIKGALSAIDAAQNVTNRGGGGGGGGASNAFAIANATDALRAAVVSEKDAEINAAQAVAAARKAVATAVANSADQIDAAHEAVTAATLASSNAVTAASAAVASATRAAAQNVASTLRAEESAERALAVALRDQTNAQLGLTQARIDAAQKIEDLNNQVTDGGFAARQAKIDLDLAEANVKATNANPWMSPQQREEAQLRFEEAQQHLKEVEIANGRVGQAAADANKKGVEGSDLVTAAQQKIIDANQKVADSQSALALAVAAANQAQIDGAANVEKAEEKLTAARKAGALAVQEANETLTKAIKAGADAIASSQANLTNTRRTSAESVVRAQQAVITAQRSLQQSYTSGGAAGVGAANAVAAALAKLSPAGRAFVQFITGTLRPEFEKLKRIAETGFLPGLQTGLKETLPLWPLLEKLVGNAAGALGKLAVEAGKALNSPTYVKFFKDLVANIGPDITKLGETLGNVVTGFVGIFEAFRPVAAKMGADTLALSAKFATIGKSQGLKDFVAYVQKSIPVVGELFGKVFRGIGEAYKSLEPIGLKVVQTLSATGGGIGAAFSGVLSLFKVLQPIISALIAPLTDIAKAVAAVLNAIPPNVLTAIVAGILAVVAATFAWNNIVKPLVEGFKLVQGAVELFGGALKFLAANPIVLIIAAVAAVVVGVIYAYNHFKTFRDVVTTVFDAIKVAALFLWHNVFEPVWDGIQIAVKIAVAAIKLYWEYYMHPVFKAIGSVLSGIGDVFTFIWQKIIVPAWDGIGKIIGFVWRNVIRPVFDTISSVVGTLGGVFRGLGKVVSEIWDGIGAAIKGSINIVIAAIDWIIDKVNAIQFHIKLPSILGGASVDFNGIGIPRIPQLAEGGIATKPMQAIIGEAGPEAIIPLTGRNAERAGIGVGTKDIVAAIDRMHRDVAAYLRDAAEENRMLRQQNKQYADQAWRQGASQGLVR